MSVGFLQFVIIAALIGLFFGGRHLGRLGGELGRGVRSARRAKDPDSEKTDEEAPAWVGAASEAARAARMANKLRRGGFPWP